MRKSNWKLHHFYLPSLFLQFIWTRSLAMLQMDESKISNKGEAPLQKFKIDYSFTLLQIYNYSNISRPFFQGN